MRLNSIREAAVVRTNYLLTSLNSKNPEEGAEDELNKISGIFGIDFKVYIYKSIITEITQEVILEYLKNKETRSRSLNYLAKDLKTESEKSSFSELISLVFTSLNSVNSNFTLNFPSVAQQYKFFSGLANLNVISQLRLIIGLINITNEKFKQEGRKLLVNVVNELVKKYDNENDLELEEESQKKRSESEQSLNSDLNLKEKEKSENPHSESQAENQKSTKDLEPVRLIDLEKSLIQKILLALVDSNGKDALSATGTCLEKDALNKLTDCLLLKNHMEPSLISCYENIDTDIHDEGFRSNVSNYEEQKNYSSSVRSTGLAGNSESKSFAINFQKLLYELGPNILMIKQDPNKEKEISTNTILDFRLTERVVAEFIIYLMKNSTFSEDKDNRMLIKMFLKAINQENLMSIDENTEKKINLTWNLDAFYKVNKSFFGSEPSPPPKNCYIEDIAYLTDKSSDNKTDNSKSSKKGKEANKNKKQIYSSSDLYSNRHYDVLKLFSYFDNRAFCIKDKKNFDLFTMICSKLKITNGLSYLLHALLSKPWKNESNQIETLEFILNNPIDTMNAKNNLNQPTTTINYLTFGRKIRRMSNFDLSVNLKNNLNNGFFVEIWSNLDIVGGLLKIAREGNLLGRVKKLFEWPNANVPELILLALFQLKRDDFLHEELLRELLPNFLGQHVNSVFVMEELWNFDYKQVIATVSRLYSVSNDLINLSRILDLTQKLKDSLIFMCSCENHEFTINLGLLAVKRDFLHIDQWLSERISSCGDHFIETLLNYLKDNVITVYQSNPVIANKEQILEKCQLSVESLAIIFENLNINQLQSNSKVSKHVINDIMSCYLAIFEIFDELQQQPMSSEETEEKANQLFQDLFHGVHTIGSLVDTMRKLKYSTNKLDNEVFSCVLHSMLDEYRFFHKYPDKELFLMAGLYGQCISNKILDGIVESIVFKYIIEGLKKQQGKLFMWACTAIEEFVEKLINWPSTLEEIYKSSKGLQGEIFDKVSEKYAEYLEKSEKLNQIENQPASKPIVQNPSFPKDTRQEKSTLSTVQNNTKQNQSIISSGSANKKNQFVDFTNSNLENNDIKEKPPKLELNPNDFYKSFQNINNHSAFPGTNVQSALSSNPVSNIGPTNSNYNMMIKEKMPYISFQNPSNDTNPINMLNKDLASSDWQTKYFFMQGNKMNNMPENPIMNPSLQTLQDPKQNRKIPNMYSNLNPDVLGHQPNSNLMNNMGNNSNSMNMGVPFQSEVQMKNMHNSNPISNSLSQVINNQSGHNVNASGPRMNSFVNPTPYNQYLMQNNQMFNQGQNMSSFTSPSKIKKADGNSLPSKGSDIFKDDSTIALISHELTDKINLIFLKMTKDNIREKANEIKALILLNDSLIKWFSNFLILKRVCTESNHHGLYSDMISLINLRELYSQLIKDSIIFIRKLLQSEKLLKDQNERFLLKNLGSWLGIITLQRNKPILAKDLNLKDLLIESYQTGKLSICIVFVSKILEHSVSSRVFHNRNPWILSLLSLLAEFYFKTNIKQNIKFEIEILYKKLDVNISKLPMTKVLEGIIPCKDSADIKLEQGLIDTRFNDLYPSIASQNMDSLIDNIYNILNNFIDYSKRNSKNFNNSQVVNMQIPNMGKSPLNEKIAKNQMSGNSNLNQNMMNVHGNMQNLNMSGSFSNKFYQNPENQINNPSLSKNELISTITVSLQNAINEILSQVVERAVNISLVTTRELVIKDFSFDPDDIKFKTATIMCMKSLAGSLATVTCKEPLRIGFINQFRDQLSKRGIEIDNEFFASISKINDILEIGSNFIQNYVVKRAIEKIEKDKTINEELEKRGKNKDTNLSPPETKDSSSNQNQFSSGFINSKIYNIYNTKLKNIPDVLKPSRNGLTPDQFKIYEDFENIIETDRKENSVPRLTLIKMIAPAIKEFLETDQNSNFINKFDLCLLNIQFLAKNSCDYFDEDENLLLLSKMISNSNVHYSDDDLKLLIPIAMKFIIHACRNNNLTLINLYTEVLRGLADLSAKINKAKEAEMNLFTEEDGKIISNNKLKFDFRSEITNCIFENNDVIATKMLYEIHVYLYKKSLLDNNLYATYIMENIKDPSLKNDTLKLLAFLKDRNIISMNPQLIENKLDDYNYIELFFNRNFEKGSLTSNESSPSKFILDSNSLSSYIILNNEQFVKYRDFVQSMFNKFITVCYHSNPEQLKLFVMSITEIYHRNKNELKALFLVLVENVIRNDLYYEEGNSVYSDTLPRLVLFLITYMNAKSSDILHLFLFSVGKMMVLDLARMRSNNHEGRGSAKNFKFKEFSAKPYFKILFNILYLISQINEKDENTMNSKNELLEEYGNFMLAFKPLNFPAFALAWLDILSSKCFEQVHNYKEKMFYFISEIVLFVKKLNSIELNFFEKSTFLDQVYKYFFLISHSNPQFLSACALMLVKMLPEGDENFTQLKNIILSAEPVDQELTINVEAEKQQDTNNSNSNDNITVDKKPSFKGVLLVDDIVDIHQVYPSFATDIESIIKENEEEAINEITSNISEYLKGLLEKEYKGYVETKNENSPDCNFDEVKNALWVLLSLLCSRINKISKSINKNLDREENKEELNHCKSLFTTYSKIVESVFSIINNITTSILPDQTEADKVRFLIISFYISSIINNIRFDSEVSRIFSSLIINLLQDNENSNDFKAFIEEQIVRSLILRLLYKPYPRAIVSLTIEVFDKVALFRKSFISSISNQVEELFKFVRSYKGKHDLDNYV